MIQLLLVVIITMEDIKKAIGEAEKELEVAERLVASKRSALMASVFLLGWLTFSFRSGPTCTVHQRGKTEATVRHQIKPSLISMQFKVLSCPEVNAKQLYRLTSLGAGPPEAAARPTGEECRGFEGWGRIFEDVKLIFETYLKLKM